jgi:ankyrin repeat protein
MHPVGPLFRTLLLALLIQGCAQPDPPTINLYLAIHSGNLDQIKRHLFHGTDIDQPDRNGQFPLHVAAERGRLVIARLLIDHGARLDARDRQGHTPLEVAVLAGKIQIAVLMLELGASMDAQHLLFEAIRADADFRDVFEFLVERGADVNQPNAEGETPLLVAIDQGNRLLVKRLIDQGADVNLPGADGTQPLQAARAAANNDIVRLLQRFGARVDQGDAGAGAEAGPSQQPGP